MGVPIIDKALGSNDLLTKKYIYDNISLTKSIVIKSKEEEELYSRLVANRYPNYTGLESRYLYHLAGMHHPVDVEMTMISLDSGTDIVITIDNLRLHTLTRTTLLEYSSHYKELVNKYPEQELLLKSMLNLVSTPIEAIEELPDYSIVSYNKELVESREDNLILALQERIDNYKVTKLLPQYSISDSLFMVMSHSTLYTFILESLLAIRLGNVKTIRAHSYHVLNYLSSHKKLDRFYRYLSDQQNLFLYRNLLYLQNHSGSEFVFNELIEKLFDASNISVVTYLYNQTNSLDTDYSVKYDFRQRLLNKRDLVYDKNPYSLEGISKKEIARLPTNESEYITNHSEIDSKLKNSLYSILLTKDLETIVVENTDVVRYKYLPTLIDYWAYLNSRGNNIFLVRTIDPITNVEYTLSSTDAFKLFTICLYKLNGVELTTFPDYRVKRVLKDPLPTIDEIKPTMLEYKWRYTEYIEESLLLSPKYSTYLTTTSFSSFINDVYRYNLGTWLFTSNLSDAGSQGTFEEVYSQLHQSTIYSFNDETVDEFINRIGITDLLDYSTETLEALNLSILDYISDNGLSFINRLKYLQRALTEVFKEFNSYTVQFLNTYSNTDLLLVGHRDSKSRVKIDSDSKAYMIESIISVYLDTLVKDKATIENKVGIYDHSSEDASSTIDINKDNPINTLVENVFYYEAQIPLNQVKVINPLNNWIVTPSVDSELEFLSMNL